MKMYSDDSVTRTQLEQAISEIDKKQNMSIGRLQQRADHLEKKVKYVTIALAASFVTNVVLTLVLHFM